MTFAKGKKKTNRECQYQQSDIYDKTSDKSKEFSLVLNLWISYTRIKNIQIAIWFMNLKYLWFVVCIADRVHYHEKLSKHALLSKP